MRSTSGVLALGLATAGLLAAACLPRVPEEESVAVQANALRDPAAARAMLEKILVENILPFWYPHVIDPGGGYRLNHDIRGRWKGDSPKSLVTQARTCWFFARIHRTPWGRPEHLQAAQHGFQFLRDRMWDHQHGGFFWEVDSQGSRATVPVKHLYGQAFGLYALAEYARASGDGAALDLARTLFRLLEERAHDPEHGGYVELFERDWSPATDRTPNVMGSPSPAAKLMNTHLHLMEALTTYCDVAGDDLARERLLELIAIQSNAVVRKTVGACTDKYERDWTPLRGEAYDVASYGHDVENVWLLLDACRAARVPRAMYLDLCRTLFGYSLKHGYDPREGGFFDAGPLGASATRRLKIWWVQAEGLVGALYMYRLTGEQAYLDCFARTLDWIARRQADWENGDWFETVTPEGESVGGKAHAWKGPYHNGRAMIECLELLGASGDASRL